MSLRAHRGGGTGGEKPGIVHRCTECGREGFWGPEWSWYGSLQDEDNGRIRVKACSDHCRDQADRAIRMRTTPDTGRTE